MRATEGEWVVAVDHEGAGGESSDVGSTESVARFDSSDPAGLPEAGRVSSLDQGAKREGFFKKRDY